MNRLHFLHLAALILPATMLAAPPPEISKEAAKAYGTVRDSKAFMDTAVGFAGETPEVVEAFRILIKQPNPSQIFKSLIAEASLAGQLYALCGLYHSDYKYFETIVGRYRHSEQTVQTMMGCIVSMDSVASLVESSAPSAVRLKDRNQTTKQWVEQSAADSMTFDIVGGGWPNEFWERDGYGIKNDEQAGAGQPANRPESK